MAEEQKRPVHEIKLTDDTHITIEDNNGRLTGGTLKAARERAFPWLEAQAKAWVKTVAQYAPERVQTFIKEKESSKTPYREILKTIPDALYKPINGIAEIDVLKKGTVTYKDNSEQVKTCTWEEYLTEIGPALEREAIDLYCQPDPYARKEQTPEVLAERRAYLEEQRTAGALIRYLWLRQLSLRKQMEHLTPEQIAQMREELRTKHKARIPRKKASKKKNV